MNQDRKGFTLIELIVVVIVIGILVLLATSRFIHYIKLARFTNILNDIKVVETVSLPEMIKDNDLPRGTAEIPINNFDDQILERIVYSSDGYILLDEKDDFQPEVGNISELYGNDLPNYYLLNKEEFIEEETRTKLKGEFLINLDGDVLYVDDEKFKVEYDNLTNIPAMFTYNSGGEIVGIKKLHPAWDKLYKGGDGYRFPKLPEFREVPTENGIEIISIDTIAPRAFENEKFIGNFEAPYIKTIGDYAFSSEEGPGGSIFEGEFYAPRVEKIGKSAFEKARFTGNFKATEVELIGDKAFYNSKFDGIFFATKVSGIDDRAFFRSEFSREFYAPSLLTVGEGAFYNSRFVEYFYSENIEKVGSGAFSNSRFQGKLYIPRAKEIGAIAFSDSVFTGSFNAPDLVRIGTQAFFSSGFSGDLNVPSLKVMGDPDLKTIGGVFNYSKFNGNFNAPNLNYISTSGLTQFTKEIDFKNYNKANKGLVKAVKGGYAWIRPGYTEEEVLNM